MNNNSRQIRNQLEETEIHCALLKATVKKSWLMNLGDETVTNPETRRNITRDYFLLTVGAIVQISTSPNWNVHVKNLRSPSIWWSIFRVPGRLSYFVPDISARKENEALNWSEREPENCWSNFQ